MEHKYSLIGTWNGGLMGDGRIEVGNLKSAISVPADLKGPGKGTNPEELLTGAAATCYLITLAAILERRKVGVVKLELSTEGFLWDEKGHKFTKLVHRPRITLAKGTTDEQVQTVRDATDRAEKACMVSNAMRGNVAVTVEPSISLE